MKQVLYYIERLLLILLTIASCMGLFFGGCFVVYMFYGGDALTSSCEMAILFASILVVIGLFKVLGNVRYKRLELELDELEQALEDGGESQELYEHLTANLR